VSVLEQLCKIEIAVCQNYEKSLEVLEQLCKIEIRKRNRTCGL
jgi:hypothetical protein